ncbi:hypothetical protein GCM10008014_30310 [Paenibacillus silvae]|uniref:Carrier domain-containing protein n=1 Tax=Paenibacillus silvae TaxID=1325358 RepID=A0ABQ1ZCG6_9BACL|nr:acyl carrier protein [Paenibacillus silvae]GGH58059.1 hypothetical protein GCM10008014_30310 [Paenibacillus silvae]
MLNTRENVKDQVSKIIQKHIELNIDETNQQDGLDISAITSLKFIGIVVDLELEFDFVFEDEYLDNRMFNSFDSIVTYVYDRTNLA